MGTPERMLAALTGRPYLLLSITTIGWAGNAVAGRLAVGHVSPMMVVTLRWLVVMIVLGAVAGRRMRAEWPQIAPHWRFLACMGALGYTIFNAIFYWSAHYTSAVNMGVLQGVTPALVAVMAFAAYGSRLSSLQFVGAAATVVGTLIVASRGSIEVLTSLGFNVGDVGILVASLLYSGYTVALRRRPAITPIAFFGAMSVAAFLTSLPLVAVEAVRGETIWPHARGWALVLYIGLVPSLVSQLCFMRAVQLIGPNRAGLFMNLVPIVAAVMGVGLLGEHFGAYHAAGLVFVLGGIWLAERRPAAA